MLEDGEMFLSLAGSEDSIKTNTPKVFVRKLPEDVSKKVENRISNSAFFARFLVFIFNGYTGLVGAVSKGMINDFTKRNRSSVHITSDVINHIDWFNDRIREFDIPALFESIRDDIVSFVKIGSIVFFEEISER